MNLSYTEENYLKAIYEQGDGGACMVPTNTLAAALQTSAAAVTEMVRKLHEKGLVVYQKYQGVQTSPMGKTHALQTIRKHLLWEVFLVDKLKLGWEEVHEIAEQLEHIQSLALIRRLDDFLGNPRYGPHGEAIPNAEGALVHKDSAPLTSMEPGETGVVSAIKNDQPEFVQYLNQRNIYLGAKISVVEKIPFDQSMDIRVDHLAKINISQKASDNILITP